MGNTPRSNADRERIRQEADARRQARENKVFYTLTAITVAIVAVFLIASGIRTLITTPTEIRNLDRIQDNWLVIDVDQTVSKHYHHPASFDAPAGYIPGEMVMERTGESHIFTKYNDGVCQDFYLEAEDENALVAAVYVDAAANQTAKDYIQRYIDLYGNTQNATTTIVPGVPFTATLAGETAQCLYLRYNEERGSYGVLLCAFDAPRNVCVNAQLSGAFTTPENVQTQEQLLAEAEVLLAGLTIVH